MNRLEKKCIIGSAALHGLLLVVLLFASAFLDSDKHMILPPVVTLHNVTLTDRPIASGGNPNANPPPAAPPKAAEPPPPQPPPPPVKEQVKHKEEEQEPEPKPKKEVVKTPDKEKLPVKDKTTDKAVETAKTTKAPLNLKPVRKTNDTAIAQREIAAARAAAVKRQQAEWDKYAAQQRALAGKVGEIIGNVSSGLGKDTVAEVVGPGSEAYANYSSVIIERYKRAVYASQPQSDQDADAVIRVVISRDGTVRSSQWVRRTNNPILNKAVDRAMNSVRSLPPFPAEAKDSERTFNITIAFEARVSA